jgi:hypothetical protein
MNARRGSLTHGAVAVALLLWARAASAKDSAPPIDVFVAGTPDRVVRLESAIDAADRPIRWVLLDAIDVADVVRRPRDVGPGAARAWVDCSRSDRVRIYFANWNSERFLLRDVPLPGGWNELGLESLGQVIESSLSALIANDKTGMSRAEMTSVLKEAPGIEPVAPQPPAWSATWGAFYAVQAFAPEQLIEQGPGLIASLGQREGLWRLAAWISSQYRLPETIQTALIGVRLDTVAVRAGILLARALSARIALALYLGLGGDVVHIAPRQGPSEHASLSPERFSWESAGQLALAGTVRVGGAFVLSGAVLADADFSVGHYDVRVDGSTVRAVSPWSVRPGLMAGVTWP